MTRKKDAIVAKSIRSNIIKFRKKVYPEHGGQKKFAEKFGFDYRNWGNWERGDSVPTELDQRKLAEAFGISLAQLRGDASPTPAGGGEESVELMRLAVELMAVQGEIAALCREILEAGFSRVALDRQALQESLQRIRDSASRVKSVVEEPDRDSRIS